MNKTKNCLLLLIFVPFYIFTLFSQTQQSIEEAINKATSTALSNVAKNQRIAVIHVASPSNEIYDFTIETLETHLSGLGFRVMNRDAIVDIKKDLDIDYTTQIDDLTLVQIGAHINADVFLTGFIDETNRRLRIRVLNHDADVIGASTEQLSNINIRQTNLPIKLGKWNVIYRDNISQWTAEMVIQSFHNNRVDGFFDWHDGRGQFRGREFFEGSFNDQTKEIIFRGTRHERSRNIGLGVYRATVSSDGIRLVSGTQGGAGSVPGTWSAEWVGE